jgi:hypothetical protein
VLGEAWDGFIETAPEGEEEFTAAWMKARAGALEAAGYDVFFR